MVRGPSRAGGSSAPIRRLTRRCWPPRATWPIDIVSRRYQRRRGAERCRRGYRRAERGHRLCAARELHALHGRGAPGRFLPSPPTGGAPRWMCPSARPVARPASTSPRALTATAPERTWTSAALPRGARPWPCREGGGTHHGGRASAHRLSTALGDGAGEVGLVQEVVREFDVKDRPAPQRRAQAAVAVQMRRCHPPGDGRGRPARPGRRGAAGVARNASFWAEPAA